MTDHNQTLHQRSLAFWGKVDFSQCNRDIAKTLGCAPNTVGEWRRRLGKPASPNPGCRGVKFGAAVRARMSSAHKRQPVAAIELASGKVFEFPGITMACRALLGNPRLSGVVVNNLKNNCYTSSRGQKYRYSGSAYGYFWMYL